MKGRENTSSSHDAADMLLAMIELNVGEIRSLVRDDYGADVVKKTLESNKLLRLVLAENARFSKEKEPDENILDRVKTLFDAIKNAPLVEALDDTDGHNASFEEEELWRLALELRLLSAQLMSPTLKYIKAAELISSSKSFNLEIGGMEEDFKRLRDENGNIVPEKLPWLNSILASMISQVHWSFKRSVLLSESLKKVRLFVMNRWLRYTKLCGWIAIFGAFAHLIFFGIEKASIRFTELKIIAEVGRYNIITVLACVFAFCAVCGLQGALISILRRLSPNADHGSSDVPFRMIYEAAHGARSIDAALISGGIFGCLVFLLAVVPILGFGIPEVKCMFGSKDCVVDDAGFLNKIKSILSLGAFCFAAGFAEKFVPDILDGLTKTKGAVK